MAEETEAAAPPKPKPPLSTILILANTLFVIGALGTFVYTKILFKKPVVTEQALLKERKQQAEQAEAVPVDKQLVMFEQAIVNLAPTQNKAHYVTLGLAVEVRDAKVAKQVEEKKAQLTDKMISILGHKQMNEVNTIQGKLLLKTQLIRSFNELTVPGGVMDVYFSSFVLQ